MKSTSLLILFLVLTVNLLGQKYILLSSSNHNHGVKSYPDKSIHIDVGTLSRLEANQGYFFIKITNISDHEILVPNRGICWNDAFLISKFALSPEHYKYIKPNQTDSIKISWHLGQYKKHLHKTAYLNIQSSQSDEIFERVNIHLKADVIVEPQK